MPPSRGLLEFAAGAGGDVGSLAGAETFPVLLLAFRLVAVLELLLFRLRRFFAVGGCAGGDCTEGSVVWFTFSSS